jgi:two-component sensor histidine kinase
MHPARKDHHAVNRRGAAVAPEIETGIEKNTLRLQCPNTGRDVHGGIIDRSTRLISFRARCPICEDVHDWQVGEGNQVAEGRLGTSAQQHLQSPNSEISELREQLLDELNHRHKNSLQMLYDLLEAARRKTHNAETREVLSETSGRIGAMGTAQQVFYSVRDSTDVSGQGFLEAICANARVFLRKEVSIHFEPTTVTLPKETAMPLALVLNELLTNAAKHGANDRGLVAINVGLSQRSGSHELTVQDRGPGFNFEKVQGRSSGLGLVTKLARRLNGAFTVERRSGARCTLRFPDQ